MYCYLRTSGHDFANFVTSSNILTFVGTVVKPQTCNWVLQDCKTPNSGDLLSPSTPCQARCLLLMMKEWEQVGQWLQTNGHACNRHDRGIWTWSKQLLTPGHTISRDIMLDNCLSQCTTRACAYITVFLCVIPRYKPIDGLTVEYTALQKEERVVFLVCSEET